MYGPTGVPPGEFWSKALMQNLAAMGLQRQLLECLIPKEHSFHSCFRQQFHRIVSVLVLKPTGHAFLRALNPSIDACLICTCRSVFCTCRKKVQTYFYTHLFLYEIGNMDIYMINFCVQYTFLISVLQQAKLQLWRCSITKAIREI